MFEVRPEEVANYFEIQALKKEVINIPWTIRPIRTNVNKRKALKCLKKNKISKLARRRNR